MSAPFICQATTGRRVKTVHLTRRTGSVEEHIFFSVTPETLPRAFHKGDTWNYVHDETGIHLTPVSRAGTNGMKSG